MLRRIKPLLVNSLLATVATLVGYLVIELVFFRLLLPHVSLNLVSHLPDLAGVLAQNSKADFLPRNYVAILGDSYAEGVGDWFWDVGGDRSKPYHSANVIHDAAGRDVVSFGRSGSGSAEAIVLRPARILSGTKCWLFPDIAPPRELVIYFYEGNDVTDNLKFLQTVSRIYGRADDAAITRYLEEDYASVSPLKCHTYLLDTMWRIVRFIYRHHIVGDTWTPVSGRDNALRVAGRTEFSPGLNGPALEVQEPDIRRAMNVLGVSLAWLRRRFPDVSTTVVYIPTALSIYRIETDTVAVRDVTEAPRQIPRARVKQHNDLMCNLARDITLGHGVRFLDAGPALRAAASSRLIHGPRDWDHPNETGYRALGQLIASRLQGDAAEDTCGSVDN